jgi:hypothetical protein
MQESFLKHMDWNKTSNPAHYRPPNDHDTDSRKAWTPYSMAVTFSGGRPESRMGVRAKELGA